MAKYDMVLSAKYAFDCRGDLKNISVGIKDGKIVKVTDSRINATEGKESYRVPDDCFLFPGFVDPHGHFRDEELEYKETYATASRAAAAHGITTAGVMPNTIPVISNPDVLEANIQKARNNSLIDVRFWVGMDEYTKPGILKEMGSNKMVCGGKIFAEQLYLDELEDQIIASKRIGKRVAVHCEDIMINEAMKKVYEKSDEAWAFSLSRPDISEAYSIFLVLSIAKEYDVPIHVLHISSEVGLRTYSTYRKATDTCETAFHYIMFSMDDMANDQRLKMKPPLKAHRDSLTLRDSLYQIDCIGTDHAPHLPREKIGKWETNIPGIPVYDAYSGCIGFLINEVEIDPSQVAALCSWNPAGVLGLTDRGMIKVGAKADFAVFNPNAKWQMDENDIRSKCGWSPWEGHKFRGKTIATFRAGVCIAKESNGGMQVIEKPGKRIGV